MTTYNPVTAGFHCPHTECATEGRIDLHHVFWTCPAAVRLRQALITRWRSAGLRLPDYEMAIFSLELPTIPRALLEITGRILADTREGSHDALGDSIDRIVQRCWSLGAAMYLHGVWRWRVAHFDAHNDVSAQHHVAGFETRLRRGHETIAADGLPKPSTPLTQRIRRAICAVLGGNWAGSPQRSRTNLTIYLVLSAGRGQPEAATAMGGIVIALLDVNTGRYQVHYMGGFTTQTHTTRGSSTGPYLSILRGLTECERNSWGPCHVAANDGTTIRQMATRKQPTHAASKAAYWKARRMADAVGVHSWTLIPRECNRATHVMMDKAKASGETKEWRPARVETNLSDWKAVHAAADRDIKYWWSEHGGTSVEQPPDSTV